MHPEPADPSAAVMNAVIEEVYDTVRTIAAAHFRTQAPGHTLQATAVVHEAFARIIEVGRRKNRVPFRDREHCMAIVITAMRQVLVDHARAHNRLKRGPGVERFQLLAADAPSDAPVDVLALNDLIDLYSTMDPRGARMLEYRFFGGMNVAKVAECFGVSKFTVENEWRIARAWLSEQLDGQLP